MLLKATLFLLLALVSNVHGHGKLLDPPGRNAVMNPSTRPSGGNWINCPNRGSINYSDKGQFCGGRGTQEDNGGKCSACGDNYVYSGTRPHDYGGQFATDITAVRAYKQGQVITAKVLLSAAHRGSFQFRICNMKQRLGDKNELADCFLSQDNTKFHLLRTTDGNTNFTENTDKAGTLLIDLQLPVSLTCPQGCTFQWWYRAGNNPEPTFQEHFVNCADILIMNCQDFKSNNHAPVCALGATEELESCNDEDDQGEDVDNNDNAPYVPDTDDCPDDENDADDWDSQPDADNEEWSDFPSQPTSGEESCARCAEQYGDGVCSACCDIVDTVYTGENEFITTCCKVMCPTLCPQAYCKPKPVYSRQPNCYLPGEYRRRLLKPSRTDLMEKMKKMLRSMQKNGSK